MKGDDRNEAVMPSLLAVILHIAMSVWEIYTLIFLNRTFKKNVTVILFKSQVQKKKKIENSFWIFFPNKWSLIYYQQWNTRFQELVEGRFS